MAERSARHGALRAGSSDELAGGAEAFCWSRRGRCAGRLEGEVDMAPLADAIGARGEGVGLRPPPPGETLSS
ncbi:MAG: hypothetical protein CMN29_01060 [Sandaracinus sp.]|nr:hypothetical protein [Sandaracinus sp.]